MITTTDTELDLILGVHVSPAARERFSGFEAQYLSVREKERRILSLEEVRRLPYPEKSNGDYELWKIRRKSIRRFMSYISGHASLRILDVGCGNGFFANMLTSNANQVVGVDINLTELIQAAAAFPNNQVNWYYLDLLQEELPENKFDLITFCSSFHYFNEPEKILDVCLDYLKPYGEIHIIDSPFYSEQDREVAEQNTAAYYRSLNATSMASYYHHNTFNVLKKFKYACKYKPRRISTRFMGDSPFPWIIIRH